MATGERAGDRRIAAIYWRRRIAALAVLGALLAAVGLTIEGGGGSGDRQPPADSPEEQRRQRLDAEPARIRISASGDLLLHSPVYQRALAEGGGDRYDFAPMLHRLRPWVEDVDLAICHVETPISASAPPSGYPLFNAPPELAEGIAATGWDACTTASNHTLDLGQEGVEGTLRTLRRAGIEHSGSHPSRRASRRPPILEAGGVRVALLAYTTDTNGLPLPEPFSVNVATDPGEVIRDARRASERGADAVIVNVHWGSEMVPEYVHEPADEQRRFARELARAPEVTAIVGQGPHVVQSIERLAGKPVVFSEGNLLSNQGAAAGLSAGSQDGLIALLDLVVDGEGARVERVRYVPVWVRHPDYVVLPVGEAARRGSAELAQLAASYERTVDAAGHDAGVRPVPRQPPG